MGDPARPVRLRSRRHALAPTGRWCTSSTRPARRSSPARREPRRVSSRRPPHSRGTRPGRRIDACRAWAWTVDCNWYPGDCGAEIVTVDASRPPYPDELSDDPETRLLEACVRDVDLLLSVRALIEGHVRQASLAIPGFVDQGRLALQHLHAVLEASGATWSLAWVTLACADLFRRSGDDAAAEAALDKVRQIHEFLRGNGVADPVGEACACLVEGDWYAAPGSRPSASASTSRRRRCRRPSPTSATTIALRRPTTRPPPSLSTSTNPGPSLRSRSDALRSPGAARPRDATGRVDRRRGGVRGCRRRGRLLARGRPPADRLSRRRHVAATRREAGTRFDLRPRGSVAALVEWADKEGSASFASGLGRLLQRVGEQWLAEGEYERAEVAYSLVPLLPRSGAEVTASLLLELAAVDARRQLGVRAATRLRQALATLPPVADATSERLEWMRQVNVVVDIVNAHMSESATAAGTNVGGLDRSTARLRALLALPGVPEPGSAGIIDAEHLAKLARSRETDTIEDLVADADRHITEPERKMLSSYAEIARQILNLADPHSRSSAVGRRRRRAL